jgi:hypothetical protein
VRSRIRAEGRAPKGAVQGEPHDRVKGRHRESPCEGREGLERKYDLEVLSKSGYRLPPASQAEAEVTKDG